MEIISPEKTVKAFTINQSGARERVMVSMVGVIGKEKATKSFEMVSVGVKRVKDMQG